MQQAMRYFIIGAACCLLLNVDAEEAPECSAEDAARTTASHSLLEALALAGASHVPLKVATTAYGGLGVFVTGHWPKGTVIMRLPSSLMLTSKAGQASLPLALARQRRRATSDAMKHYVASLPDSCPNNLAIRANGDLELVESSLHAWKVALLRNELQALRDHPPQPLPLPAHEEDEDARASSAWTAEEMQWATCMKLSRAFAGMGHGPVMMPFVDLCNHEARAPSCDERGVWVDEAAGTWEAQITALRDLHPGDEITYAYSESPSKARMLTSFGFSGGAPSASLGADDLPEREIEWLAAHGCAGPARTDLVLEEVLEDREEQPASNAPNAASGGRSLTDAALRAAVRCIRLRLYEPEEAAWALESGHLDAPWGGAADVGELRHHPDAARLGELVSSILQKDLLIAENTHASCMHAVSDEQRGGQRARMDAAAADMREAVAEELDALDACAEQFAAAREQIAQRGEELFGGG